MKEVNVKVKVDTSSAEQDIKNLDKSVKELNDTSDSLTDSLGNVGGVVGETFGQAQDAFNKAKSGVSSLTQGMGTLKGAIISTGIGALVIAVTALATYFSKTKEGADLLGQGMAFLQGGVSVLMKDVISLGKWLVILFTEPQKAIEQFSDFIQEFVINRFNDLKEAVSDYLDFVIEGFKAISSVLTGDFDGAMEHFKKSMEKGAGAVGNLTSALVPVVGYLKDNAEAINENAKAMMKLEKESQALIKSQQQMQVENAKIKAQLETLKNIRDDESKSLNERIEANNKLAEAEQRRITGQLANIKEEMRLAKERAKLTGNDVELTQTLTDLETEYWDLVGESEGIRNEQLTNNVGLKMEQVEKTNAQIDAEMNLKTTVAESEEEKLNIIITASNKKLEIFRKLGLTERQEYRDAENAVKQAEANKTAFIRERIKEQERLEAERIKAQEEKDREAYDRKFKAEQDLAKRIQDIKDGIVLENMTQREKEIFELDKEYKEKKKILTDAGEDELELAKLYDKKIKDVNDKYDADEKKRIKDNANAAIAGALEVATAISDILSMKEQERLKEQEDSIKILVDANEKRFSAEEDALTKRANLEIEKTGQVSEATMKAQEELAKAKVEASNQEVMLQYKLELEKEKIAEKEFKRQKALNIATAVVNGAQAVTLGLAQGGPPLAVINGVIASAQLAKIVATKYQKNVISAPTLSTYIPSPKSPNDTGGIEDQATGDIQRFRQQQLYGADKDQVGSGIGMNQKVYVTERDIRNTQRRVNVIERSSEIG